ncbi:acyl-CoA dehydrogenase family protein [Ornithinimicrobium faecis]|uniref:acyl-CoA dehydrogenase family protein n=1 Tax=Ornithinimicrobium faecis TaxID=2934158 RepID=UPI002118BB40|nr:acyl-CoA dehydrogenase family protein [Ornithinimicrobium sp. HY1745]
MKRTLYGPDHEDFRRSVAEFLAKEVIQHIEEWERDGIVPRTLFNAAARVGINGLQIPVAHGGSGVDSFLFNAVVIEETGRAGATLGGLNVHLNTVLDYFLKYATPEQARRWLPGMASGELVSSIAMTEPGTGSDLAGVATTAVRDGDEYVVNGSKTFITGGVNADLVVTVVRTSPTTENRRSGLSLLVVETDRAGFSVGRRLDKLGLKAQDTAELFYDDVRVPVHNRLGKEGDGFAMLTANLPQERLTAALGSLASATCALRLTLEYVQERQVFGRPISDFQNTKFVLAGCATELTAGQAMADQALLLLDAGELGVADAAAVKLFCTEMQGRVVDACMQMFGGYGYMLDFPISRLYADARVSRIYGGTSEVMKSVISKSLGL